jgi:DNA repair exonuclease SbcCD ATPase subunit
VSDSGNLIMELDNHITSVIQNFDFTDLDVSEQIEDWVQRNFDTEEISNEVISNLDITDFDQFNELEYKVTELEEKAEELEEKLNPMGPIRSIMELESQIRAQGMMIEGLTNHVLELEERLKLAAEAFTKKILNAEEMADGGIQKRGRPGFAGREDDQASDETERAVEGEAEAGDATE